MNRQATLELRNLPDRLADHLVLMIARGELQPGQRIFEKEICELQGVSRIPVREALRLLQAQGVVRSEPNRGTYVTEFTVDEMLEMLELRLAVERAALRRISARGTSRAALKSEFIEVMAAMRRAATLRDRLAFCQADLAFHHRIVELAASPVLTPTWQLLSRGIFVFLMQRADFFTDLEVSISRHEHLLALLVSGEEQELDKEIESHIAWSEGRERAEGGVPRVVAPLCTQARGTPSFIASPLGASSHVAPPLDAPPLDAPPLDGSAHAGPHAAASHAHPAVEAKPF